MESLRKRHENSFGTEHPLNLMFYLLEQSELKNINFENSYGLLAEGRNFQKMDILTQKDPKSLKNP
jgi:hypothetical protein